MKKTGFLLTSFAALLTAASASAQDIPVKIGVLTDLSGVYADASGPGSVFAAELAKTRTDITLNRFEDRAAFEIF